MYWIAFGFAILISFWVFRQMPKDGIWWMINSILGFDGYFYVLGITPFAFYQLGEWFLGCIICLYIMAPLLLIAIDKYGLWKVSGVSILIWGGVLSKLPDQLFVMYIPHMLMGMIIIKYKDKIGLKTGISASILVVLLYLMPYKRADGMIYSLVQCSCLFIILKYLAQCVKGRHMQFVFSWIAKYSYAIFLVHHKLIVLLVLRFDLPNFGKRDVFMLFTMYCIMTAVISVYLYKANKKVMQMLKF